MNVRPRLRLAAAVALGVCCAVSAVPVSELSAAYRHGQAFLTWNESETPPGTTFNIYLAPGAITTESLAQSTRIGHHVERHSARDWWQDPASFASDVSPGEPAGFVIETGAAPLDPRDGLFVHTVTSADPPSLYFAVTTRSADGVEDRTIVPGRNALRSGISGKPALIQPVWLSSSPAPTAGVCKGKGLTLSLHGRGGGGTAGKRRSAVNCLVFGDATQGWREGLASKFQLSIGVDNVTISPMNRTWVGRPVSESKDRRDHCPAVNTWWYGTNERIYETTLTEQTVCPNYTERYLLYLVRWAQEHLGTEAARTTIRGGSMGGSGTVAMALHFPQVFAAAYAEVPVYSCTKPGSGSAVRLECTCGPLDKPAFTAEGIPLLDYMNGALQMANATVDTPPIFATNGRQDGSIPWENNPPFYAAANSARQAFSVYWNNGQHGMSRDAPADCRAWSKQIERYRLDQSYLVFTNSSDNRNYGNGDRADGELEGWINRGLGWKDLMDTPREYAVTVTAVYDGITYPVTVDVTPRRIQRFRLRPGDVVLVRIGPAPAIELTVDRHGLLTIPAVAVAGPDGTRVCLALGDDRP